MANKNVTGSVLGALRGVGAAFPKRSFGGTVYKNTSSANPSFSFGKAYPSSADEAPAIEKAGNTSYIS